MTISSDLWSYMSVYDFMKGQLYSSPPLEIHFWNELMKQHWLWYNQQEHIHKYMVITDLPMGDLQSNERRPHQTFVLKINFVSLTILLPNVFSCLIALLHLLRYCLCTLAYLSTIRLSFSRKVTINNFLGILFIFLYI